MARVCKQSQLEGHCQACKWWRTLERTVLFGKCRLTAIFTGPRSSCADFEELSQ